MKKSIVSVILSILLLLSVFPVCVSAADLAASGTLNGGAISWTFDKEGGILRLTGSGPIPNYNGSTQKSPFCENREIKVLFIGEGITSVGSFAFFRCEYLTHVQLPSTVTDIGEDAFGHCYELRNIVLPGALKTIGAAAFELTALPILGIPDNVTTIGDGAFDSCKKLKKLVTGVANRNFVADADGVLYKLTSGVKTKLVQYPAGLSEIDTYVVPDTVTEIAASAFSGNETIRNVMLQENVTKIGRAAFFRCSHLERVAFSKYLTSVGNLAFSETDVKEIYYTGNQTAWMNFKNCMIESTLNDFLKNEPVVNCYAEYGQCGDHMIYFYIDTANSLKIVGCGEMETYDFDMYPSPFGYMDVKTVFIDEGVEKVSDFAFFDCGELTDIQVDENNQAYTAEDGVLFTKDMKTLCVYPAGRPNASFEIPDGTETVGAGAFYGAGNLKQLTLPLSVRDVLENAFENCGALDTVYYGGTKEEWEAPLISIDSQGNEALTNAKIIFTVRSFSFKIAAPEFGKTPDTKVALLFGMPYVVESVAWTPDDETFKEGTAYTVTIRVEAADGYTLVTDPDLAEAFVNGNKAGYELRFRRVNFQMIPYALITFTFPAVTDPNKLYAVTVTGGKADKSAAKQGETVTLTADPAPEGKVFDKWQAVGVTLADASKENTTFVMPANDVTLTAVYKDMPKPPFTPGDVDADGKITAGDARLALRAAVQLEAFWNQPDSAKFLAADVTKDKKVAADDARHILRAAVGLEDPKTDW